MPPSTAVGISSTAMPAGRFGRATVALLLILAAGAFLYRLGAMPLLDDPNEAEYAEVAREMVESGDWISPRLNYVLFLNKPPLTYWAIGLSDLAFGATELAARLPSALSAVVIVGLLWWLGTLLFDAETGLLAGFVLIATAGFFVETHEARPDPLLTAGIVGGLVAFVRILRSTSKDDGPADRHLQWPYIGLQLSLAVGLLAKGMVALVIPGLVIAALLVTERRFDLIPRFLHPRAWWLFLLIVTPWHVVMSVKHPGFLWDYVVNQHVLFFFDRKFPRDSVPVSLSMFWVAFGLRLFPWTLFAPLAFGVAMGRLREGPDSLGYRLTLAWAGAVLLFFSVASSRMEHYSIPALPAVALLMGKLFRDYARGASAVLTRAMTLHVAALLTLAVVGLIVAPGLVEAEAWLASVHQLPKIARAFFALLSAGVLVAVVAALARRRHWVAPAIVATFVAGIPLFLHGMSLMAPVDSSAPMAAVIRGLAEPDDTVVYEAPTEYQNCAGFNFYLRRKLDLLLPAGFIAPPYLQPHLDALFIDSEQLAKMWQSDRVFFISDPLVSRSTLAGVVPEPTYMVARDRVRWIVTNFPMH